MRSSDVANHIINNANIFTADPTRPHAKAVAIENGKFSAIGNNADILATAVPTTRVIDVGGRLVTLGLTDAHVHLGSALPLLPLPSAPVRMPAMPFPGPTGDQALAEAEAAAKAPGDWITAFIGPAVARDQRNWHTALDAVSPDRPVMLRAFWGHRPSLTVPLCSGWAYLKM